MSKTFKLVFVSFLLSASAFASHALPPTISCGDYRVAQGNSCGQVGVMVYNHNGVPTGQIIGGGFVQQQQAVQQQQISQQQLNQVLAQQAIRVPFGQQVPQGYCSWGGRIENLVVSGLIGAVMGNLVGGNRSATQKGAAAGMVVGLFVPCNTPQVVQQVVPQQVVQQGSIVQQGGQQGNCPSNTSWKRLDWEGHPQNGKYLCLPSDEQIRMDKEKAGVTSDSGYRPEASSSGKRCPSNTSWKRLDWEGHPQHGKEACLPSDEQIRMDKEKARERAA